MKWLRQQAFVNNEWINGANGGQFEVFNPADGKQITQVADLEASDVIKACDQATSAFNTWSKTTSEFRAKLLRKWYHLILQEQYELALLLTSEQGKPLAEAVGEINYGAAYFEWFAEEARRAYGDIIPTHELHKRIMVTKQPVGVAGIITPWNFPVAMIARKAAAALAAGCTVVVKPSELTPLSALALAALAAEAGLPAGVFNVVTTTQAAKTGVVFCTHPAVRKISFTGSTVVGKKLMAQAAEQLKSLTLELGGNAPFIVCEDADPAEAIKGLMQAKFRNAGQTCICANRVLVHQKVASEFMTGLIPEVEHLTCGPGTLSGVQVGPLIQAGAVAKVHGLILEAQQEGAQILTGGQVHALGGNFYQPTIITGLTAHMNIQQQEIFGPVIPITIFNTDEEVIALANATTAGLAAYFYSQNIDRIYRLAEALDYGMIGINTGLISTVVAPFGGIKESGFGREGSKYGLEEYLYKKYWCLELNS